MTKKHIDELERISSVKFRDNFSECLEKSMRNPVMIMRRKRPIAVMLYWEDYNRLYNWISVKDKLPEYTYQVYGLEACEVIVSLTNKDVVPAIYIENKWEIFGVSVDDGIVTHWMHFPDAPISEK